MPDYFPNFPIIGLAESSLVHASIEKNWRWHTISNFEPNQIKFTMRQILFLFLLFPFYLNGQPCTGGLLLTTQQQIDNFPINYPGCTSFNGPIRIVEAVDGAITNVDGLSSLQTITGQLKIESNTLLNDLTGLSNLTTIGGELFISVNDGLSSLASFQNLNFVGSHITIQFNPMLVSLSGLEGASAVNGDLKITTNISLANLTGLNNIQSIDGQLQIRQNSSLTNLVPLQNLTSIDGSLVIMQNGSLPSLQGLENIDHTTIANLTIFSSSSLSECDVASICDYLAIPANTASINFNATGCNSRTEVETACTTLPVVWHTLLTATLEEEVVHLNWSVAYHENNKKFVMEWSRDGKRFMAIDIIPGLINSKSEEEYHSQHRSPSHGDNYYRVKQVDHDGQISFGNIAHVNIDHDAVNISPNPFYSTLTIFSAQPVKIEVLDIHGRAIQHFDISKGKQTLKLSYLPSGVYFLRTDRGVVQRLIKR